MEFKKFHFKGFSRIIVSLLGVALIVTSLDINAFAEGNGISPNPYKYDKSGWQTVNLSDWMSLVPDGIQLSQINIPGTHDTGTKDIAPKSKASCHDWYIPEQLENGIRYLDIRVNYQVMKKVSGTTVAYYFDKSQLEVLHGFGACYNKDGEKILLPEVIKNCQDFLKDHPSETIIMRVVRERNHSMIQSDDEYKSVDQKIKADKESLLKDTQLFWVGDTVPSMGEVRGKIVFLDETLGSDMVTKYEDAYEVSASDKKALLKNLFETSYLMNPTTSHDRFIEEGNLRNHEPPREEGNPNIKLVCTNLNGEENPRPGADAIIPWMENYEPFDAGTRYGWFLLDFPTTKVIRKIISTNPQLEDDSKIYWEIQGNTLYLGSSAISGNSKSFSVDSRSTYASSLPWYESRKLIEHVKVDTEIHPLHTDYWFYEFEKCNDFYLDNLKTDRTYTMNSMFEKCIALTSLDISSFTSTCLNSSSRMFYDDANLQAIYALSFNATALNSSNALNMFKGAYRLKGGNGTVFSSDSTDNARAKTDSGDSSPGYFTNAHHAEDIYWGIHDNVLYIGNQSSDLTENSYQYVTSTYGPGPNWSLNRSAIEQVTSVKVIDAVCPDAVNGMNNWFKGFSSAVSFDLEQLDTRNCTKMNSTFEGCSNVKILDLSGFNKPMEYDRMFANCSKLETIYASQEFNLSNETREPAMFEGCIKIKGQNGTVYDTGCGSSDQKYARLDANKDIKGYFSEKTKMYWGVGNLNTTLYISSNYSPDTPYPLADIKYEATQTPWYSYRYTILNVKVLDVISPIHMSYWFHNLYYVMSYDISKIETGKTQDMECLFAYNNMIGVLDIKSFKKDSLQNVAGMFDHMTNIKTILANEDFDISEIASESGRSVFSNDTNLVGGNGTAYSATVSFDGDYARCDLPGQEGYFTVRESKGMIFWGVSDDEKTLFISSESTPQTQDWFYDTNHETELPWTAYKDRLSSVSVINEVKPVYTDRWFKDLQITDFDLELLNTENTVDMSEMFYGNKVLSELNITALNGAKVKKATSMFAESNYETILADENFDLTGLNSDNSKDMFKACSKLRGGMGTAYSSSVTDSRRALCDGKNNKQGYFTNPTSRTFKYSFKNWNGSVLQDGIGSYGSIPSYIMETPTRPKTDYYIYEFTGWNPEIGELTANTNYIATYSEVPRLYFAIYEDEDGTILDYLSYQYGERVPKTDLIPQKDPTEEGQYVFDYWKSVDSEREDTKAFRAVYKLVDYKYEFTEGSGSIYTKGSGVEDGLIFKISGPTSKVQEIIIKGEVLSPDNYILKGTSTIIELKKDYLETLSPGLYDITVRYEGGQEPSGIFYVKQDTPTPPEPPVTVEVTISKTDEDGAKIGDASLRILGIDNNFAVSWTTVAGEDHILDLEHGSYILIETNAPEEYEKASDVYFKVREDDEVILTDEDGEEKGSPLQNKTVIMVDKKSISPDPEGTVIISKADTSGKLLSNAHLTVYGENVNYSESWISKKNEKHGLNLNPGIYVLTETQAPMGYKIAEDIRFKVKDDASLALITTDETGQDVENPLGDNNIVMTDEESPEPPPGPIPTLEVTISKEGENGEILADAHLSVLGMDNNFMESWVTLSGQNHDLELEAGNYILIETQAPKDYNLADNITFEVTEDEKLYLVEEDGSKTPADSVVMVDRKGPSPDPGPTRDVTFSKTDSKGNEIGNAHITVVGITNNFLGSWVTSADQEYILTLPEGTYLMMEKKAPAGYEIAENIKFRIKEDLSLVLVKTNGSGENQEEPVESITMVDIEASHNEEADHVHTFEWSDWNGVTKEADGKRVYACTICGYVLEEENIPAYAYTCRSEAERVLEALPNATIICDMGWWNSYPRWFFEKLATRNDVNITLIFTYEHKKYSVSIPAGAQIDTSCDWYGPLKILSLYEYEIISN